MKILLLLLGFLILVFVPIFANAGTGVVEQYETMRPQLIEKLNINETELKALDNRMPIAEWIKLETRTDLEKYYKDNLIDFSSPYFDIPLHQKEYFQMTDEEKEIWDNGKFLKPEFGNKPISQIQEQFNDLVSQCERMKNGEKIPLNEQYLDSSGFYRLGVLPETNCKMWADRQMDDYIYLGN